MQELDVVYLPISALREYELNARKHEKKDVDAIIASIREFGFLDPIGIWGEDNTIVEGHGRLLAARELDMETVPCIRLDDLTDEQRRAYALAHNRTAELSGWDFSILNSELEKISDINMSDFCFDLSEFRCEDKATDDEYEISIPQEPTARMGQIFVLGKHRLMCGDSTNPRMVSALMGGAKADLVFTDPPYGVAIGDKNKMLNDVAGRKGGRIKTNIANDAVGKDELYGVLVAAFTNLRENCKDDASYYVTAPQGGDIGLMMMMMREAGLEVRHNLIWEKSYATFSMGRLDYDYNHEPIFYTWTKKHNFYGNGQFKKTVWQFPKPRKCDLHPTMKPVELVAECILNSSKEGDVVADIFGGSGTTIIACEQLNRSCRMMELDPQYVDVIIDRWEKLTGEKAVLLNDT